MMIELRQAALTYQSPEGETEALRDITFDMEEGEFVSIVGPSGCGKSALANAYACASCLPRATVELSSVSSALDLKGCLSTYEGADFSIFLKAFKIFNTNFINHNYYLL